MRENYDEYKKMVDEHLLDFIPNINNLSSPLFESMKYSLTAGGKRLRSVLLLASCEFAGGKSLDALAYASAMEYIQTYSLIHDDLPAMDNDDLRRGIPTNHKVYGAGIATLAGDGLLNTAFEIMYRDMFLYFDNLPELKKRINAAYAIAKGAGVCGMVAGQVADIEAEHKQCSNEVLEYIHLNKTGALIVSAVEAGLYIGGADDEMMKSMVCLVKPQFEAGREQVGKNGIVRDTGVHLEVVEKCVGYAEENGLYPYGLTFSPVKGAKGNIEFLLYVGKNQNLRYNLSCIQTVVKSSHEELK